MSPSRIELSLFDALATEAMGAGLARAFTGGGQPEGGQAERGRGDGLQGGDRPGDGGHAEARQSGLRPGDGGQATIGPGGGVIHLRGELGAGKTTCARSLLRALGVTGLIRSPTYTLLEVYRPAGITCVHIDLYRVGSPAEVEELGLRDYLEGAWLLLAEWPERGASALPPADLDVHLTYAAAARRAELTARSQLGSRWITYLAQDTSLRAYVSNLT